MDSKELAIKEKRTIEATKKDLMGPIGKLGIICRYLGQPIYYQSMGSNLLWEDPYDTSQDHYNNEALLNELPVFDEENGSTISAIGWLFDGTSSGMHLEIKYLDFEKKLTVNYKGYLVYCEIAGELDGYVPSPEWEGVMEKFYKLAKERKKKRDITEKNERKLLIGEKQKGFLQKMRERWGI